jgi:hypothetical protein
VNENKIKNGVKDMKLDAFKFKLQFYGQGMISIAEKVSLNLYYLFKSSGMVMVQ